MNKSSLLFKASLFALLFGAVQPVTGLADEPKPEAGVDEPSVDKTSVDEPYDDAAEASPTQKILKKAKKKLKSAKENTAFGIDSLRAELGGFNDNSAPDSDLNFNLGASMTGRVNDDWEFALGMRLDAQAQTGSPDFSRVKLDYAENFLRWRSPEMRITLGTQNLLWGRVDEISPIDRLSRTDLSHFILDRLPDRRRAVPALRLESFQGDFKIDAAWLPFFDPAVLPDAESVWHPVDTANGRILGLGPIPFPFPGMSAKLGGEEDGGSGGAGVRVTHTGGSIDYGFSLQRARQSIPYYEISATPGSPAILTLTAVHPYSWVVGGELETQVGGATWRLEATWSSDLPVTDANTFSFRTEPASDLVMGVEFFPGDGETRITLQVAGHKTHTSNVLDRTEFYNVNGEIERSFAQGRWRGNLRFFSGLNDHDIYLNPKLTYLGIDKHELFIAAHIFDGSEQTLGGFHKDHDMISVGWQAKF
jgi:hypothetical protein